MTRNQSKTVVTMLSMVFLLQSAYSLCGDKKVFIVSDTGKPRCIDCPDNCSVCYRNIDNKPTCVSCENGYFLTTEDKCEKCSQNCNHCIGKGLKNCSQIEPGYFYNITSKSVESCQNESCARCYNKTRCQVCKEGHYTEEKSKTDKGLSVIDCVDCGIENCKICHKKKDPSLETDYVTCSMCKEGYGVVSGKCEKCTDNCQFCMDDSQDCTFCEKGYFLDKKTRKCLAIPVDNCYTMKNETECAYCESHYYYKDNECKLCRDAIDDCNFCAYRDEKVVCLSCEIGHHRTNEGECEKCPENCNHCNKDKCTICRHGYFYDEIKDACLQCEAENCRACSADKTCAECKAGYFIDKETKQCKKCDDNCLKCSKSSDNCTVCPINYYSLQDQVISQTKAEDSAITGLLTMFLGVKLNVPELKITEIKIVHKCFEKCPAKYKESDVVVNEAERKCEYVLSNKSVETIHLPEVEKPQDILSSIKSLKIQVEEEIQEIVDKSKLNPNEQRSKECNYHGLLKKEIRGNYESYYICRCDKDFLGDNCQLTSTLYEKIQTKLTYLIEEIQKRFMNKDNESEEIFLKSFIQINKFKVNRKLIEKMISLVQAFLVKDKDLDNKKNLYVLYDNFLLNLFDLAEDLKKVPYLVYASEVSIDHELAELYKHIHTLLDLIEKSFEDINLAKSFLADENSQYTIMGTSSYVLAEHKYNEYQEEFGFHIANPNIDTSFNNVGGNVIRFDFTENTVLKDHKLNLQLINFASPLFNDRMNALGDVLVSNVLYMKHINPENPSHHQFNFDAKINKIRIEFSMNFIPAFEHLEHHIFCRAYSFQDNQFSRRGEVVRINDDEQTVLCEYPASFEVNGYYFGVSILK